MFEEMRGVVSSEDLKNNTRDLEVINNQIEGTANPEEKEALFQKAEQVEAELAKIESMMGISAEEMLSFYETITPEDAEDIVTKTIEKIPMGFMKGDLWTTGKLKQFGGQIMLWASIKSPLEAAMIAASVLIVLGGAVAQEARADKGVPVAITHMSEENPDTESVSVLDANNEEQDGLKGLDVVHVREGVGYELGGGLATPETTGVNQAHEQQDGAAHSSFMVNGETARVLEDNKQETVYGGSKSIHSEDIHKNISVGTIHIKK